MVKYIRSNSKWKWTDCEYRVQNISDVNQTVIKICFSPIQFPVLPFFGPHAKPHGFWGFRKIVIFDQNLNWYMKHVEYAKYPDVVSHVQTCSTHPGYPVFNILNKPSTNLLCTTHTGLSWSPLTTETSSILPIQ